MKSSIYNYDKYKRYLLDVILEQSQQDRTYRQKLCDKVGCQPSYLSQVLNAKPDFTLEQAHRLNQFFFHDKNEARFFILLVEKARAGTVDLREFFQDEILAMRESRLNLKKRLKETEEIPETIKHKYYSTWFYAAIHMALAVPGLQTASRIAEHFRLPLETVLQVIRFLEDSGLVENVGGRYHFTKKRLHLGSESDFIQAHHINWRSQSLQSVEKNLPDDLHFSTVFAISKKDFKKIKEILITSIEAAREIIKPSESEEVCAITLDFFRV